MAHIIPIFIPHLGCSHTCVFCNQQKISATLAAPRVEAVRAMIEAALPKTGGLPQLAFYGGSFTAVEPSYRHSLLALGKEYIDRGLLSGLRVSTRPDCLSDAVLAELKTYGVLTVELGAQSMDDHVLLAASRGHTAEAVAFGVAQLRRFGFQIGLQAMVGLPLDTREKSIETAKKLIALRPDFVRIYPVVVLKDTALADLFASGQYTPPSLEEAVETAACMLELFEAEGIPVIRIGLQAEEGLEGESLGGAYHPALGEMVQSRVYRKQLVAALEKEGRTQGEITISVHPKGISKLVGQKKSNLIFLKERYPTLNVNILQNPQESQRFTLRNRA